MEAPLAPERVREVQLGLLDDFAAYADRHGLTWFLYAGTLLGAARHQGYIPWDDDLDVAMPREDYRRLLTLLERNPIPGAFITAPGRGNPLPFAKLSREGTRLVEPFDPWPEMGVNIDIFPVDSWPSAEAPLRRLLGVLNVLVWLRIMPPGWGRSAARRAVIGLARRIVRPLPVHLFAWLIEQCATLGRGDQAGVLVWGVRDAGPGSNYLPTTTLTFEGRVLPAPGEWGRVLTSIYGDWQTPPPEDQRTTRHLFTAYRVTSDA